MLASVLANGKGLCRSEEELSVLLRMHVIVKSLGRLFLKAITECCCLFF